MKKIDEILAGVKSAAIAGHINPDGDCVGSCMAMYLYLKEQYSQIDTDVYLGTMRSVFDHLEALDEVKQEAIPGKVYDLLLLFDVSSEDRIGIAGEYLHTAKRSVCIDHHITNRGLAQINQVEPEASSACEVLFGLLDPEKISLPAASALYTGMIHDSGVFQYSNTSGKTMRIAGWLMEKGIPHTKIIEDSFYKKSYVQNRIMGQALLDSKLFLDGKCIAGVVTLDDMKKFQVTAKDLDGIVNQMRLTAGVEAAVFLYGTEEGQFKASMRSNGVVDVSSIAASCGGGGHRMAAGCTMDGKADEIIQTLVEMIGKQL